MTETVCQEADRIVYGDREQTYGHPAKNFDATAALWQAYFDHRAPGPLNARDVARMMVLLKLARQMHMHKRDNLVDGIGYFACEAKINDYDAVMQHNNPNCNRSQPCGNCSCSSESPAPLPAS